MVTVELNSKDESFRWVIEYLSAQKLGEDSNNLAVETSYDSESGNDFLKTRPNIMFTPAPGYHFLPFQGKTVWVQRVKGLCV